MLPQVPLVFDGLPDAVDEAVVATEEGQLISLHSVN
jgi:hypothetical protein